MPVRYDEKTKIFTLNTKGSTYAFGVNPGGYLVHLYYGKKLPSTEGVEKLWFRGVYDSLSPQSPYVEDPCFSLDIAPLEFPCSGAGDMRITALSVRGKEGNAVTDLHYKGHRIFDGKPALQGLPATFAKEGEAQSLEIALEDRVTGVTAFLLYTVFENYNAMARSLRLENRGAAPVDLERVYSACLELPGMDFDMVHLHGRWAKENTVARHALHHGLQGIRSRRGMTGPNHNPFLALARQGTAEETGEAYGVSLVYSGNFALDLEVDERGSTRVLAGINPDEFRWRLEPGEGFTAPEAVLVYSDEGLGGMSRTFHKLYLNHLMRSPWAKKKRPLLINSWEAALFDFDDEKLVNFAKAAKELGIEMLVMDDGWFGDRHDDRRALGDWQVNEEKLKGGLSSLIKRVNDLGIKFGIWYEPEMINPDSDLYRAHPDWVVCAPGREKSLSRHQCVLDMTREDVRDNIFGQMCDVISKNNIEYIKWDCNRHISEAASLALPPERQGEFFHRYVLGVYDLMDRLTAAFPHILLENCSSGGGRFDPGMLYYSPQIWASDNTDPIERLTIQFGASMCYPASSLGAHVSACPRTDINTRAAVALWGTFGYELDPYKLTEEEKEAVKAQVADYHKYYDLTHYGDLYRLTAPTENPFLCDWMFVSEDKGEALYTRVIMRRPDKTYQLARLRGLSPDKIYRDEETGELYSGAVLMYGGLDLSARSWQDLGDGTCVVKHFIAQ